MSLDWAKGSVAALIKAGYVSGDDNKKINPKKALTRAEGVTVLNRSKTALDEHKVITKGVYKDGVYTGTGAGYGGTMKLQVTIKDGKISDIQILSQSETGSYLERAKTLLDKIKANNGTSGVNAVSGATRSSNGIFDAVNACLSQAEGGKDTSTTGATGGGGGGSGSSSTVVEPGGGATILPDGSLMYTGSSRGYGGTMTVQVTVKDSVITGIKVSEQHESSSYYNGVEDKIIPQFVGKNINDLGLDSSVVSTGFSKDYDAKSGATVSSKAMLRAISAALTDATKTGAQTYLASNWDEFTTALAVANNGDTVKLSADITDAGKGGVATDEQKEAANTSDVDVISSATAKIDKKITVDGDGHKITGYSGKAIKAEENKDRSFAYSVIDSNFCFLMKEADITVKNLTIDGASFSDKLGGAVYIEKDAAVSMDGVTFENCVAKSTGAGNSGGAIYVEPHKGSSPTLTAKNCVFKNNMVNGGTTGRGGAVGGYNANIVLENCTFSGNKAGYGGAVAAAGNSNLTVKNCTFEADNDGAYGGDDIYIFDGYTFYKKNMAADSSVNYDISGNTYKGTESDWKDYNVVIGRVLGQVSDTTSLDGNTIEMSCAGNSNSVFIAGHDLTFTVSDYDRTNAPTEASNKAEDYTYVLMNIPYDKFYAADVNNNVSVDAVTSATFNKTRASLSKGSYHVKTDGSSIDGVIFPVMIKKADVEKLTALGGKTITDDSSVSIETSIKGKTQTTEYKGKDALFESDSYSYYMMPGSDIPSYFKFATVASDGSVSFGAVQGVKNTLSGIDAEFTTETRYGDYEIDFTGLSEILSDATVYGVIVSTDDGTDYGMRHLENIWRNTEIAWSAGFVTEAHGSPLQAGHYASIMGKTINEVTYFTSDGIYVIPVDNINVPVKYTKSADFKVEGADASRGSANVTVTLPEDIDAQWSVEDASGNDVTEAYGFSCSGSSLSWNASKAVPGGYTLKITDKKGKYADTYSSEFTLTTGSIPAVAAKDSMSLIKAEGAADALYDAFIANIQKVSVNGTEYSASGRGAVKVIDEKGSLDLTSKPFNEMKVGDRYEIVVTSKGFNKPLSFTLEIPEKIYGYAALTYAEYWAAEDVYAAGDDTAVSDTDTRGEYDLGAFDAVTRATTTHGWHRGSYQQETVINTTDGDKLQISYWKNGSTVVLNIDGKETEAAWSGDAHTLTYDTGRETVTKEVADYTDLGIKYVPVEVSLADYADFCKAYNVVKNGGKLAGGYSEQALKAYSEKASVDANTNGLKTVTRNGDSWSFSARTDKGTTSGIAGKELKTVDDSKITKTVKNSSPYGDFIRLDLTGDAYGNLGSNMQTVRWDYYGDGNTILESYGTKFAADNWMHKSNGIQLGLTDSLRCKLPDGYTGTGKWVVTVYALGYKDYSVTINITADDIHGASSPMTPAQKTQLEALGEQAKAALESEAGVAGLAAGTSEWKTLEDHYKELQELFASETPLYGSAAELIEELPVMLKAVQPKATGEGTLTVENMSVELTLSLKDSEGNDLDFSNFKNAKVSVTAGSGRNIVTVIKETALAAAVKGTLSKELKEGTECDVTITSDNYQNITFKVNAVIKTSTAETQDEEATSETPSSVSEVLTTVKKTVNEKASENAENVSEDAEKSDAPAAETAPAAAEENASAGQTEEAYDSEVSAE